MNRVENMSDNDLIRGCVEGNTKSQGILFDKYSRTMMGICLRYAGDRQEAEDMMQEGWIKVFRSVNGFRFEGSVEGWIKRVMINTCLEILRKNKLQFTDVEIEVVEEMEHMQTNSSDPLTSRDLLKMIHRLPSGYRSVFNLFAIEGYSHKEISKKLSISEGTSKSQYSRARMHLQKMMKAEENTITHRFTIKKEILPGQNERTKYRAII
jgi:RNA polymerase sigma factor (sigma-70 family)